MKAITPFMVLACLIFCTTAKIAHSQPPNPDEASVSKPSKFASEMLAKLGGLIVVQEGFTALPPDGSNRPVRILFYGKPEMSGGFGVCSALTLDLRLRGSDPYDMRADQTYYIVRPAERKEGWSDVDREQMASACANLKPSEKFFSAPSARVAWKAAYLLTSAINNAKSKKGMRIECASPYKDLSSWCSEARNEMANLQSIPIQYVDDCGRSMEYVDEPSCIIIQMHSGKESPFMWKIRLTGTKTLESITMLPSSRPTDYFPP